MAAGLALDGGAAVRAPVRARKAQWLVCQEQQEQREADDSHGVGGGRRWRWQLGKISLGGVVGDEHNMCNLHSIVRDSNIRMGLVFACPLLEIV